MCLSSWTINKWSWTSTNSQIPLWEAQHLAQNKGVSCYDYYESHCTYINKGLASYTTQPSKSTGGERNNFLSNVITCLFIYFSLAGLWIKVIAYITWNFYSELCNFCVFSGLWWRFISFPKDLWITKLIEPWVSFFILLHWPNCLLKMKAPRVIQMSQTWLLYFGLWADHFFTESWELLAQKCTVTKLKFLYMQFS
jgi:hypothetical protein